MKPLSGAHDAAHYAAHNAAHDAGAGSGSAVSAKAMTDQLRDIDTSVLDRLVSIRQEESRLEAFRARAGDMKGQVSEPVYRRVLDDYTKRTSALEQQATPLKTKGRAEYRKLHQLIADVTRIHDQARLEKEELEFRHAVGELDDEQLSQGLQTPQGRLDQCEADLARIDEYSARFIEAFGSKAALDAPEPAAAAPRPSPALPPVRPTAPVPPPVAAKAPVDLDATAFMPSSSSPDTSQPTSAPVDMTMIVPDIVPAIVPDDATRLVVPSEMAPVAPPTLPSSGDEEGEGQTILVPMAALIAEPGSMPQTEYRLGAVNYLGRAEDNQVQIMSPEVSRKHAVITAVGNGFELTDLGSQNGVNVNGVRTNVRRLVDGDRVEIAGIALVFRSPWPAARATKTGATGAISLGPTSRVASSGTRPGTRPGTMSGTIIVMSTGADVGSDVSGEDDEGMNTVASRSTRGLEATGGGTGAVGLTGGCAGDGRGAAAAGSGASSAAFDPNASMKRAEYSSIRARSASH